MDWAEEKYDVSAVYTHTSTYQYKQYGVVKLIILSPETPDCPGEDGAEGAVPLHPSAHVLGSL